MERFFIDPRKLQQKRQGPLGRHIEEFATQLSEQGYSRQCACRQLQLVAELSQWMGERDLAVGDLTAKAVARFLRCRVWPQHVRPGDAAGLKAFFKLLCRKGLVIAPVNHIEKTAIDKLQDDFSVYLRQERFLAPTTITNYLFFTKEFLAHRFRGGPINLSDLKVAEVVRSVQRFASSLSRKRAKVMTSALRSFLRYARYRGFIRSDLAACVPCVADWSVPSMPKGLPSEHVNRVLASCNRRSAIGRRDYAILLLLVRLGLRAGEVASVVLEDIDWEAGCLTVRGKGNRSAQLPLPVDVGKAIASYLKDGRQRTTNRSMFLRMRAPAIGFKNGRSVSLIVNKALARAGINCHRKGAHQFRHALATQMLRNGASLAEIGEVLRHRNPQTSSIYAKVDFGSLRKLALPWPGGVR